MKLRWRSWCAVMVVAATALGCAPMTSPSAGGAAPSSDAMSPSASGAPTPTVSTSPSVEPPSPADALVDVPPTEGVLNSILVGDGTIVAGGFEGPTFVSTILAFDGTGWVVAEVPDEPGQVTGIARIGNRLIAVGNGLPDNRTGFIWESEDGQAWQAVQTVEDAAIYDVIAGDGIVVAVGASLDAEMNATATVWFSTDGATWERGRVAGGTGTSMGSITAWAAGLAATGDRPLGEPRPFWTATEAGTWAAVQNDLDDQLLPTDVVAWRDGLALVGASGRSGDQHPVVSLSPNGGRWERTILSPAEGYASSAGVADGRLVVAGIDADVLTLWSLRDGAWDPETYEPSGASISALAWDAEWGLVGVGARDNQHAVWLFETD